MPAGLTVRPATEADLPAIGVLWLALMRHHQAVDPRYAPSEQGAAAFTAHVAGSFLGKHDALALVAATQDGALVGYLIASIAQRPPVFADRSAAYIHDLAVEAGSRRRGVGRALTAASLAWFAVRGVTQVEVRRHEANGEARAFWDALGFTPTIAVGTIRVPPQRRG